MRNGDRIPDPDGMRAGSASRHISDISHQDACRKQEAQRDGGTEHSKSERSEDARDRWVVERTIRPEEQGVRIGNSTVALEVLYCTEQPWTDPRQTIA
jgi:hypothetical protein